MREYSLLCLTKRGWVTTTCQGTQAYPNLIPRMVMSSINQPWVADITYIRLRDEFIYLEVILDAFSRKCIGWELSECLDIFLPLTALKKALVTRSCARPPLGQGSLVWVKRIYRSVKDLRDSN